MADTTLVQITLKVNNNNYKEYERCLEDFLNSFVCYDVDTEETPINEEHPTRTYTVRAYDSNGTHTAYYTVRENGDTCEIYDGCEVDYEQLMEEKFVLDEDEILTYIIEDLDFKGYTVETIDKEHDEGIKRVYRGERVY